MTRLPAAVRQLALRCGASEAKPEHRIALRQEGVMRNGPNDRWMAFHAEQTISVLRPSFRWTAKTGPLGLVTVVDALRESGPRIRVQALGVLTLARPSVTPELTKGELMRYLAELPWAPDAILHNHALDWQVLDARRIRVATACGATRATVDLELGDEGLVVAVSAADRPRIEGDRAIERPWWGRFSDYRDHAGRRLPFRGEAGWRLDGAEASVWRGLVTSWTMG